MHESDLMPLSVEELEAESATALPAKEVVSLLDLNLDLDLGLDLAAPIDLAVAANANVAAPIDAAVGANVLSEGSVAQAMSDQGLQLDQGISGSANAVGAQGADLDQTAGETDPGDDDTDDPGTGTDTGTDTGVSSDVGSILDGDLLDVDVKVALDADLAAPINGAVAANANVAAPIDAAVAANVASIDSEATAVSQQDAIINQHLDDVTANADASQQSEIDQ